MSCRAGVQQSVEVLLRSSFCLKYGYDNATAPAASPTTPTASTKHPATNNQQPATAGGPAPARSSASRARQRRARLPVPPGRLPQVLAEHRRRRRPYRLSCTPRWPPSQGRPALPQRPRERLRQQAAPPPEPPSAPLVPPVQHQPLPGSVAGIGLSTELDAALVAAARAAALAGVATSTKPTSPSFPSLRLPTTNV